MNTDNLHIDDILKKVKRIHFIGIGGAGNVPTCRDTYSTWL